MDGTASTFFGVASFTFALAEFMCGFFGIMLVVFLWVTTEKWKWHSHKSYENLFWGAVSFWASIAIVARYRDSWFFPQSIIVQMTMIVTTPIIVMIWHRHRQTLDMTVLGGTAKAEMMRRFTEESLNKQKIRRSLSVAQLDTLEAKQELAGELETLIGDLNYGHMTMRAAR